MIEYLIYLLTFIIGSIIGLLYSYKQHNEPFVIKSSAFHDSSWKR